MPAVSQAQFRAMEAAKEGKSTLGIPAKVGREFTQGFAGQPGSVKALPARKSTPTSKLRDRLRGAK